MIFRLGRTRRIVSTMTDTQSDPTPTGEDQDTGTVSHEHQTRYQSAVAALDTFDKDAAAADVMAAAREVVAAADEALAYVPPAVGSDTIPPSASGDASGVLTGEDGQRWAVG